MLKIVPVRAPLNDGGVKIRQCLRSRCQAFYLYYIPDSRSRKRRCPNENRSQTYEYRIKCYDDLPTNARGDLKAAENDTMPHYIQNWSKHNPPYISSPTLLTGLDDAYDLDKSQKLPIRDISLSVVNKETSCHDVDLAPIINAPDGKTDCGYKTNISWHENWNIKIAYYICLLLCCHLALYN